MRRTAIGLLLLAGSTAPLLAPTRLAAQAARPAAVWLVPVDFTQGLTLGRGTPVPFTASARLNLSRGFGPGGRFRIGPTAAVVYDNPDWEYAAGARVGLRVFSPDIPMLTRWGVYLQAEQWYGTGELAPASLGLLADLGIVRFGLLGSHDWNREVQTVEASIGFGLDAIVPLLRPSRPREPVFDARVHSQEPRQ